MLSGHPKLEIPAEPESAEGGSAPEAQKKKVCKAKFPNQPPDMTIHPFSAVAASYGKYLYRSSLRVFIGSLRV